MSDLQRTKNQIPPLRTGSMKSSRLTMARVIKAYAAEQIDPVLFKNLIHGFSSMLAYFKAETEAGDFKVFKERLIQIEEAYDEFKKYRDTFKPY